MWFRCAVACLLTLAVYPQAHAQNYEIKELFRLPSSLSRSDFIGKSYGSYSDGVLSLLLVGQNPNSDTFGGYIDIPASSYNVIVQSDGVNASVLGPHYNAETDRITSTYGPNYLSDGQNYRNVTTGLSHSSYHQFVAGKDFLAEGYFVWDGSEFHLFDPNLPSETTYSSNPYLTNSGMLYIDKAGVHLVDVYDDFSKSTLAAFPDVLPTDPNYINPTQAFFNASGSQAVFLAESHTGEALFLASPTSGIEVLADTTTQIPGTTENFLGFPNTTLSSPVAVYSDESSTRVAFSAETSEGLGIYLWENGIINEIASPTGSIKPRMELFGLQISDEYVVFLGDGPNDQPSDNDMIYFAYSIEDGNVFPVISESIVEDLIEEELFYIRHFFTQNHLDGDELLFNPTVINANGFEEVFYVITIPTPATGILFGLGSLAMLARRRHVTVSI